MRIGVIVEGVFDQAVFSILLPRMAPQHDYIFRLANRSIFNRIPSFAKELCCQGRADRIIAISDQDATDATDAPQLLLKLNNKFVQSRIPIPGISVIMRRKMEALLLCDPRAVNINCVKNQERPGTPINKQLTISPETEEDPKKRLRQILSQWGIPYTPKIAKEIAMELDLNRLAYWSQSFRDLKSALL